jgi:hypothetical protein
LPTRQHVKDQLPQRINVGCPFYVTLRDAALYITKLPKAEHDTEEWLAAMEALLLVAESDGPTMFARIGVMQALNRSKPAPKIAPRGITPRRKRAKAYDRPMKARQDGRGAASHIEAGKGYWWCNWNLWRTVPYQ